MKRWTPWCAWLVTLAFILVPAPARAEPTVYHVEAATPYHDLLDHEFARVQRIIEARAGYVFQALRVARQQRELRRARCLDRKLSELHAARVLLDELAMPDVLDDNWSRQVRARLMILETRSREILRASYTCSWAQRPKTIVTVQLFEPRAPAKGESRPRAQPSPPRPAPAGR